MSGYTPPGTITQAPEQFKRWMADNSDRLAGAAKRGTTPYFIANNAKYTDPSWKPGKATPISQASQSASATRTFEPVKTIEEAKTIASSLGIKRVNFWDATIDEINIALEVLHEASNQLDFELDYFFLAQDIHKQSKGFTKPVGGYYDDGHKTMAIDLTTFRKSQFRPIVSYQNKIVSLRNNIANLEKQIEQSEARLGRSKSMDKMLKADIKMFRSRIADIEIKIRSFEKLIASGNDALPLTVAASFEDVKQQVQAEIWHEIGHYVDHRTGRQRFKEGNFISEYCKDLRGEEFAEWYSYYKMHGEKNVPSDLLSIFKSIENQNHTLNESSFERNLSKLRKSLIRQDHEKMLIVNGKGVVVHNVNGDARSVHFDDDVAKLIKNNYITHNHPTGAESGIKRFGYSLSRDDVFEAVRCDARGIIAETKNYRYSIQRPNNGWNIDAETLKQRYNEIYNELRTKYRSSIENHDAAILLQHFVMKQLSKEFGLNYQYARL